MPKNRKQDQHAVKTEKLESTSSFAYTKDAISSSFLSQSHLIAMFESETSCSSSSLRLVF